MLMPWTILEPIFAGLIVSVVNKYIINNIKICEECETKQEEPETVEEDSSSNATSINDAVGHTHHVTY